MLQHPVYRLPIIEHIQQSDPVPPAVRDRSVPELLGADASPAVAGMDRPVSPSGLHAHVRDVTDPV